MKLAADFMLMRKVAPLFSLLWDGLLETKLVYDSDTHSPSPSFDALPFPNPHI